MASEVLNEPRIEPELETVDDWSIRSTDIIVTDWPGFDEGPEHGMSL